MRRRVSRVAAAEAAAGGAAGRRGARAGDDDSATRESPPSGDLASTPATLHRRPVALPPPEPVKRLLRGALVEFYFHSNGLAGANLLWGVCLVAVLAAAVFVAPVLLLGIPLLAIPAVGLARMASLIVRGESPGLADLLAGMRLRATGAAVWSYAVALATVVFGVNVLTGGAAGGPLGWTLVVLALWGLAIAWIWTLALWPLLGDPGRDGRSLVDLARLAGLAVLVRPGRTVLVAVVLGVILAVATVLFIVLATTGVAFACLVAAREMLPVADALEPVAWARDEADDDPLVARAKA